MAVILQDIKPFDHISSLVTRPSQIAFLKKIFVGQNADLWLVGGTALSAYYAEHRYSYDLDLFAATQESFTAAIQAIKTFASQDCTITRQLDTPAYFHADVTASDGSFTVDVVLEKNLPSFGSCHQTQDGVCVAGLDALFATKCACLISRCSEKDLYDLHWLFGRLGDSETSVILSEGMRVDQGMTPEGLLISLGGSTLRKEACGFVRKDLGVSQESAHKIVVVLQKKLIADVLALQKKQTPSNISLSFKQTMKRLSDTKSSLKPRHSKSKF